MTLNLSPYAQESIELLTLCSKFEEMLKSESKRDSIPSTLIYDFSVELKERVDKWCGLVEEAGEDVEDYYLGQILSCGSKKSRYYDYFTWSFDGIYQILDYIVQEDYTPHETYEEDNKSLEKKCVEFEEMLQEEDHSQPTPSEKVYTFALSLMKQIDAWREEVEKEGKEVKKYWLGQILYAGSRYFEYYHYYGVSFEGIYEVLVYVVETGGK